MDSQESGFTPRNGHTAMVGIVARISGGPKQKEVSLEDQVDHGKEIAADVYDGPAEHRVIATKGKGERLDRPELAEVEALLRSGTLDLLVVEDLGRLVRGAEAVWLCGVAVDHGTRVIAPHDGIDTADATWEEAALDACKAHLAHNAHLSRRLKFKLMNRFKKSGAATAREVYGYVKPDGAKTYDEWRKDPAAEPVYRELAARLRATRNCAAAADWLKASGVPTGKYARQKRWTGKLVRRLIANPLLKGLPSRGARHTVKHHETGRRRSVKNPKGPHAYHAPHLAFFGEDEFDELNALLDEENRGSGRKPVGGADPRAGVARTRTRFPGQHARCRYCGRLYYWGGNGKNENLMCSGAKCWRCWNSIGFCGGLAARRIIEAITQELYRLDGFDAQFRELVEQAGRAGGADVAREWEELERREQTLAAEQGNVQAAIAAWGPRPLLREKVVEIEAAGRDLARRRRDLEGRRARPPRLPGSAAELRQLFEARFRELATDSPEFGDLLRPLVPEFRVHLVRLCDGGPLLPRATATLCLAGLAPDARLVPGVEALLTRAVTLDLFKPPQRERIRAAAVRLAGEGLEQRDIARRIEERPTQTAVYKALALDRRMRELGLDSPYVMVDEPPADYPRLRRHRHPRYKFEPAEGYVPPPL